MCPYRGSGIASVRESRGSIARFQRGRLSRCGTAQGVACTCAGLSCDGDAGRPGCRWLRFLGGLWCRRESKEITLLICQRTKSFFEVLLEHGLMSSVDLCLVLGNALVRKVDTIVINRVIVGLVNAAKQVLALELRVLHVRWPVFGIIGERCKATSVNVGLIDCITIGRIRISRGGMYSMSRSSSWAISTAGDAWWTLTLARRRRGPLLFAPVFSEPGSVCGAGVAKAAALALVVFMPNGARIRGPRLSYQPAPRNRRGDYLATHLQA